MVVSAAKFLRPVSTKVSTGTTGNLNSPAILVKSKSANGFLKAPLAYIGKSPDGHGIKAETRLLRFCCGAQRQAQFMYALQQVKRHLVHCTKNSAIVRNYIFSKKVRPSFAQP